MTPFMTSIIFDIRHYVIWSVSGQSVDGYGAFRHLQNKELGFLFIVCWTRGGRMVRTSKALLWCLYLASPWHIQRNQKLRQKNVPFFPGTCNTCTHFIFRELWKDSLNSCETRSTHLSPPFTIRLLAWVFYRPGWLSVIENRMSRHHKGEQSKT